MKTILYFKQINANRYHAISPLSIALTKKLLSYKTLVPTIFGFKYVTKSIGEYYRDLKIYSFPAGLIHYITNELKKQNYIYEIKYCNSYSLKSKLLPSLPNIKFEEYQKKMLKKVGVYKTGVLVGPTGMGKSIVLGGIIDKLITPVTIIIVPNSTIFNQLYNNFSNWFGKNKVGKIGQGICEQKQITVCTYQSIDKYDLKNSNLKLILIDEAHLINNTTVSFLKKCKNIYYRYGVTATPQKPEKNFLKAMEMQGHIGPIISEVKDKEAESRVLPVKINMISYFCNKTTGLSYQDVMRKDILLSPLRNIKLIKAAFDLSISKNMTCLFLVDETKQAKKIVELGKYLKIDIVLAHGKMNNDKKNEIIKKLNERKIKTAVATKVFSVGTDIPNVDCIVLASARKSEIDTIQKIGRGRRRTEKGNKYLIVIDSVDRFRNNKYNKYFYNYSLERMNIYKEKKWEIKRIVF